MKNLLIAFALVFAGVSASYGQDAQLINSAKKAARHAGCLANYNGQINAQVTVVSSCFAGGFVTEVLLVPVCNGSGCETVRLAPLAKVTFYCNEEVGSVECMQ